jgi:hypothetical protein
MEMSNTLVDQGMLPIQDIVQLPMSVSKILSVVGLVLELLHEALASSTGLWD